MINRSSFLRLVQKIKCFGVFIPISGLLLTYGWSVLPCKWLNRLSVRRKAEIQKRLTPLVEEVASTVDFSAGTALSDSNFTEIWFCWLQGEDFMPEVVRLCLASIRKHAGEHPVRVLTARNYEEYVALPMTVKRRYLSKEIGAAHFSDILRVNLLAQRGGLWLDATMLITADLPEDIFKMPFYSIKTKPFGNFVSECRWAVFCLYSTKRNPLFIAVSKLFDLYNEVGQPFIDYFMFDQFIDILYQNKLEIRSMIDAIPYNNPLVHSLQPLLNRRFDESEWQRLTAETYMFKLSWRQFGDDELTANSGTYYSYLRNLYSE